MEEEHHKKEQMLCEQAIAKVMRVTVDKLAQDTEREESQSPLVQIQLTKQGVSRITHELQKRELENYIHKLHLSTREQIYKIGARQDEQDKRAEEKVNLPNSEFIDKVMICQKSEPPSTNQILFLKSKLDLSVFDVFKLFLYL
eukprot:Phypoly_transcript_27732.p1 GENE.Phypoly_transcript_27732~~Phypoly_transcript_27732.p1  ORF type:complete len:156 (+),score=26.27 Phypoly_transcript_27732:42-470(+)